MTHQRPPITILQAMTDRELFGCWFAPPTSWTPWHAVLAALFALPMTQDQAALFRQHTGRRALPASPAREGWLVVGRRGGKSRIAALVAVFLASFRDYRAALAPGERAIVMVLAADREQAKVVLGYIAGLIGTVPMLAPLVASRTAEAIHLTNRVSMPGPGDVRREADGALEAGDHDAVVRRLDPNGGPEPNRPARSIPPRRHCHRCH